ncbi:hypothetical protein NXH67_02965 [Butyrivibrio sp. DSM 10294]|nr:hypothetical protein [Butyrivibrio sp. DSM 10294]
MKKNIAKNISMALIVVVALVGCIIVAECCVVKGNNEAAAYVVDMLMEVPLPEHTELIETYYSGCEDDYFNKRCMGFMGVMLVKSDLSAEELNDYYESHRVYQGRDFVVREQESPIFYEHFVKHRFEYDFSEGNYYAIYTVTVYGYPYKIPFDYREWG